MCKHDSISSVCVSIVGDLDGPEVDALVLRYLGTIAPRPPASPPVARPIQVVYPPAEQRRQAWHLKVRRLQDCSMRGARGACL